MWVVSAFVQQGSCFTGLSQVSKLWRGQALSGPMRNWFLRWAHDDDDDDHALTVMFSNTCFHHFPKEILLTGKATLEQYNILYV
ncbi:hypothetical protein AAG906_007125 [Vitis piasezkii]